MLGGMDSWMDCKDLSPIGLVSHLIRLSHLRCVNCQSVGEITAHLGYSTLPRRKLKSSPSPSPLLSTLTVYLLGPPPPASSPLWWHWHTYHLSAGCNVLN